MIFTQPTAQTPVPKTIRLADGQTLTVLVVKPTYHQRFRDEGFNAMAWTGAPDGWVNFRLGRIRDAIVNWEDVRNEQGQLIPFDAHKLLGLMEAYPETVEQLSDIANEAFRPLVIAAPSKPSSKDSGAAAGNESTANGQTPSGSTATDSASSALPDASALASTSSNAGPKSSSNDS
jgi:hypothetical protein